MTDFITQHLDLWTSSQLAKSSAGRGSVGKQNAYGINKLRELILELAVRGRLVAQDPDESSAHSCLSRARLQLRADAKGARRSTWKETAAVAPDEMRFSLPNGWTWGRVNDTGFYVNGLAFKPADWTAHGKPIIRIQNLTDPSKPLNYAQGEFPDEVTVREGDILVSWSATLDAFIWGHGEGVLNQHIFKVIPCLELVTPRFLYWLLKVSIREMKESDHAHGLVMTHINRDPFLAHVVGIPPLPEQNRIVAKVDELMTLCDQLEQKQTLNLEAHQTLVATLLDTLTRAASPQELIEAWARIASHFDTLFTTEYSIDQLKQTIFQLAVAGYLTEQVSTEEPASALIQRIRSYQDTPGEKQGLVPASPFFLPKGWTFAQMGSILNPDRGISYGVIKLGEEPEIGGVYVLRCSNVRYREIDLTGIRKISEELSAEYGRTVLKGGEILVNVRGTLGGCAIVPESLKGFNIAREVAVIPIHEELDSRFMLNVVSSSYFQNRIRESLRGIAYEGLNLGLLRQFLVPIPPIEEQHRIVAKVDELLTLCEALTARLAAARTTQVHLSDALVEQALA